MEKWFLKRGNIYLEDFEWVADIKIKVTECPRQTQSFAVYDTKLDAEEIAEIIEEYNGRKYEVVKESFIKMED